MFVCDISELPLYICPGCNISWRIRISLNRFFVFSSNERLTFGSCQVALKKYNNFPCQILNNSSLFSHGYDFHCSFDLQRETLFTYSAQLMKTPNL